MREGQRGRATAAAAGAAAAASIPLPSRAPPVVPHVDTAQEWLPSAAHRKTLKISSGIMIRMNGGERGCVSCVTVSKEARVWRPHCK